MARHKARLPSPITNNQSPTTSIVYHDPCYLGRYQDIYDEPREIVSLAGTLVEAPRSHERSFCCGAGGGLAFLGEEGGTARVSHTRAQELVDTGAQTVGTACPFCNTMFRDALGAISEAPPQLLDIAQLTARNLPPPEAVSSKLPS
jgi:Fe-S oxidoreductase